MADVPKATQAQAMQLRRRQSHLANAGGRESCPGEESCPPSKQFFFEKKNQKTFTRFGTCQSLLPFFLSRR
jgi:hypothetical protein